MMNRCITHYLMRYRLRDQMSEAKWTSNSQSFLEQKIISQLQIPQWLQIIWCSCVINCRHSAGVCLLTTTNYININIYVHVYACIVCMYIPAFCCVQSNWTHHQSVCAVWMGCSCEWSGEEKLHTFAKWVQLQHCSITTHVNSIEPTTTFLKNIIPRPNYVNREHRFG